MRPRCPHRESALRAGELAVLQPPQRQRRPATRKQASSLTYAETDADGRAVLSELRDGTSYIFGILAAGYGMGLLEDVEAGHPAQVIRLTPPLKLAGRVTGAVDQLSKHQGKKGERYLSYFAGARPHRQQVGQCHGRCPGPIRNQRPRRRRTRHDIRGRRATAIHHERVAIECGVESPGTGGRPDVRETRGGDPARRHSARGRGARHAVDQHVPCGCRFPRPLQRFAADTRQRSPPERAHRGPAQLRATQPCRLCHRAAGATGSDRGRRSADHRGQLGRQGRSTAASFGPTAVRPRAPS